MPSVDCCKLPVDSGRCRGRYLVVSTKTRRPTLPRPGRYTLASTRPPVPTDSWERYAAERAAGVRVPPSVSTWRAADVERQAAAERLSREPREVMP